MTDEETAPTQDHVIELTTEVEPARTFTVDGEEYQLLGFEHLSADSEAKLMGNLARFERTQLQLQLTNDDKEATTLAKRLRERRITLLTELTTLPRDVAEKLPLPSQVKLVRVAQELVAPDGSEGGE